MTWILTGAIVTATVSIVGSAWLLRRTQGRSLGMLLTSSLSLFSALGMLAQDGPVRYTLFAVSFAILLTLLYALIAGTGKFLGALNLRH